jgi:hypothetical protein
LLLSKFQKFAPLLILNNNYGIQILPRFLDNYHPFSYKVGPYSKIKLFFWKCRKDKNCPFNLQVGYIVYIVFFFVAVNHARISEVHDYLIILSFLNQIKNLLKHFKKKKKKVYCIYEEFFVNKPWILLSKFGFTHDW